MSSFVFSVGLLGALAAVFAMPFLASAVWRYFRHKRREKKAEMQQFLYQNLDATRHLADARLYNFLIDEMIIRIGVPPRLYHDPSGSIDHAAAAEKELNRLTQQNIGYIPPTVSDLLPSKRAFY